MQKAIIFCWVYLLVNVWWGPNSTGETPFVFCVFLCFFLRSEDTQPTSSMCFCVFLFINFYFGHKSDRGKHLMCFVCFCVFSYRSQVKRPMCFVCFCVFFYQRLVRSYLIPGQPPNVFYVFLCFFPQRSQVTPPMCSVCFCVFFLTTFSLILVQNKVSGQTTYVFCVFLCFFTNVEFDPSSDWGNHSISYVFLCFISRAQVTQPTCSMCFCVFLSTFILIVL